jgi:hypothetical protein
MASITDLDVQEIRQLFEGGLNQARSADKRQKMRMRRKIRDEGFNLLTWEKPTAAAIMNRWEERLHDVLNVMPFGFREELFKMPVDKMQHPLRMRRSDKKDSFGSKTSLR